MLFMGLLDLGAAACCQSFAIIEALMIYSMCIQMDVVEIYLIWTNQL